MLNRVIMMGRLVTDPETRQSNSGNSVVRFRVAVDRNFVPQGQERKSDFFNCIAFNRAGDFVSRYFRKGNLIAFEGELQNDNYTDKDGKTVYGQQIVVDRAHFTGERSNNGTAQNAAPQDGGYRSTYNPPAQAQVPPTAQPAPSIAVGQGNDFVELADDTDLPF